MRKYILGFLTGTIIFSSISALATIQINSEDINYKDTNVKSAIDTLNSKAKPDYTGATTVTPTTASQTLETNNKILKSNITINAIPATYKNLTSQTTINSSNLLNGKTAYDSNGNLITGNISLDCVQGTFTCDTSCTGSQGKKLTNFKPSIFIIEYANNPKYVYNLYDKDSSTTTYINTENPENSDVNLYNLNSGYYEITNGLVVKNWGSSYSGRTIYYMACK